MDVQIILKRDSCNQKSICCHGTLDCSVFLSFKSKFKMVKSPIRFHFIYLQIVRRRENLIFVVIL